MGFHLAYWNLIIAVTGVIFILTMILNHSSQEFKDENMALQSHKVRDGGWTLLVSSFPLVLSVIVKLCSLNDFKSINGILLGNICITFSSFLFGLQTTLGYDIFHIFPNYETSFWFMFWSHRIVTICSQMFYIAITDS